MAAADPIEIGQKSEDGSSLCETLEEDADSERERLLKLTKRHVKQMMEEAITRKFIHQDSGTILALCVSVDSCLTHGLRRRALGLFKTSSSMALIKRIAKRCPAASQVLEQVEVEQNSQPSNVVSALRRSLWIKRALLEKRLVEIVEYLAERANEFYEQQALMNSPLCAQILISLLMGPSALEFSSSKLSNGSHQQASDPSADELMRRHQLANRVACLCHSAAEVVSTDSSCILEHPETRSPSPSSTDQQQQVRHRLAQRRRPLALGKALKRGGTLATDCHHYSCQEISEHEPATRGYSLVDGSACSQRHQQGDWLLWSPSMLHETLHQNAKSRLLYAKNNILLEVQASGAEHVAGYLSLHETSQLDLVMNWIPNQMIKGGAPSNTKDSTEDELEREDGSVQCFEHFYLSNNNNNTSQQKSVQSSYLDLVVSLSVSRIVLIQCQFHKPSSSKLKEPERVVLVEADGVQRAPFKFPKGGLRQFLACLDGGLRPQRRLEPAVWVEDAALNSGSLALDINRNFESTDEQVMRSAVWPKQHSDTESDSGLSSRLDSLLRRLPSLRRKGQQVSQNDQHTSPFDISEHLIDSSATNFVYRIVTSDTSSVNNNLSCSSTSSSPPPSALQATSSNTPLQHHNSTSKATAAGSLSLPATTNSDEQPTEANRFQWSLKRLARLSYKYSNSSSTGSSILNQSVPTTSDSTALVSPLLTQQTAHSSLEYLDNPQRRLSTTGETDEDRDSSRDLARVEAKLEQIRKSTSEDVLLALRTQSVQALCESMRKQLLARAFYGWLAYCRRARIIRRHLKKLVKKNEAVASVVDTEQLRAGLTEQRWRSLMGSKRGENMAEEVCLLVYHGGIESNNLRRQVWPYLLGHYSFEETPEEKRKRDETARAHYESQGREWIQIERVVKQRDREILAANIARAGRANKMKASTDSSEQFQEQPLAPENQHLSADEEEADDSFDEQPAPDDEADAKRQLRHAKARGRRRHRLESTGSVGSDASITDHFGNNIHRIDKDVQRCDRNFWYFKEAKNLDKLRNIMCTYVWQHLEMGYVQGMCDLAAPLLVIFDDECLAYKCFCQLMERMVANFPHGRAMDEHFESLKHLMQIMDPKLFEILESNGDYAHFYFCYRWLLLDFKRELVYEDVYKVWETIWAARFVNTDHFVVFMALAMVRYYRDIIIDNNMDFTDTIKFFNEMAERHNTKMILALARDCIVELQYLIKMN